LAQDAALHEQARVQYEAAAAAAQVVQAAETESVKDPGALAKALNMELARQAMTETRHSRRLFVGGLPEQLGGVTAQLMVDFLNNTLTGLGIATYKPIVSVILFEAKRFAFIEIRACTDVVKIEPLLQGTDFVVGKLTAHKTKDHIDPPPHLVNFVVPLALCNRVDGNPSDVHIPTLTPVQRAAAEAFNVKEGIGGVCDVYKTYDAEAIAAEQAATAAALATANAAAEAAAAAATAEPVGISAEAAAELKAYQDYAASLNGGGTEADATAAAEASVEAVAVAVATEVPAAAATPPAAAVPSASVVEHENAESTRVVMLKNMITVDDIVKDEDYAEIVEDVTSECKQYGSSAEVRVPRPGADSAHGAAGLIFVRFDNVADASACRTALHGRLFNGATVEGVFYDENLF
jgi:splicing factor U2AF subunit